MSIPNWHRTVRTDSHGKELVRHVAELELGPYYGPGRPTRLVAATGDPEKLTNSSGARVRNLVCPGRQAL